METSSQVLSGHFQPLPRSCSQEVLCVGCSRIHRQRLGCQEQLARSHGDILQVPDDLNLVLFSLEAQEGQRRGMNGA